MENKINIAKILSNCPRGMELDCTIYNKVTLINVDDREDIVYPIRVFREDGNTIALTKYGQYTDADFAKCVIFPKGKTTWEGFVPPCKFKDGDIIYTKTYDSKWVSIFEKFDDDECKCYINYCIDSDTYCGKIGGKKNPLCDIDEIVEQRLATEEEKQKLFDVIKEHGHQWNTKTKTLERLIESYTPKKFYIRIGDIPSEEKSAVYRGETVVGYEDGVSVYDCVETDGLYRIVMPFPLKEGQGMTYEFLIQDITQCRYKIENPRNVYLVSGMEVGKGHDNEPLIKEVKILKDLTSQFNTEETKTLEKLSKFKIGDVIQCMGYKVKITAVNIEDECYEYESMFAKVIGSIGFSEQDNWELVTDIEPKFKAGDVIQHKENSGRGCTIRKVEDKYYVEGHPTWCTIPFDKQDEYELVINKFDITTLKPFDKVLVRNTYTDSWHVQFYQDYDENEEEYPFECTYNSWKYCIPYEGNEHLRGTTDDCDKYYKTWK